MLNLRPVLLHVGNRRDDVFGREEEEGGREGRDKFEDDGHESRPLFVPISTVSLFNLGCPRPQPPPCSPSPLPCTDDGTVGQGRKGEGVRGTLKT